LSSRDPRAGASGAASGAAKARRPAVSLQSLSALLASLFQNSYVSAFLCVAALLWTLSTLGDLRARFDEVGFRCDKNDFACYYIGACAMRDGVNPYTQNLRSTAFAHDLTVHRQARAGYPPTFILCMESFTLLTFETAYWVWTGLNFAALLLSLYLLLRKDLELDAKAALSLAALALFYQPIAVSFGWGQPHMILLLMMVVAWRCFQQGRDAVGGLTLAFAGLLKIYPLFLVGYLLARRRWRAIFSTALGLLIGGAATMALVGISRTFAFVDRSPELINGGWLASVHQLESPSLVNLDTFISRLFWELSDTGWNGPIDSVRRLLVTLAQAALFALAARATLTTTRSGRGHDQRAFALWMAVVALLSPTA